MLNSSELGALFVEAIDNHSEPHYIGERWRVQPLEDGIITYSTTGFEAYSFISLSEAISMGQWHSVLSKQLEHINIEDGLSEGIYIDYAIQVNTHKGTIEAKASFDYAVTIHSEAIDYDNFSEQVKRFLDLF